MHPKLPWICAYLTMLLLLTSPLAVGKPGVRQVNLETGVKLHYVAEGPRDGNPLIFLHGATDSGFAWKRP